MLLYVVRHGETDANTAGLLQGSMDIPLNDSGRDLAVVTGRAMQDIHFDACISSPLIRAKETAEIILRESKNDIPVSTDPRIQEMCMGEWEGKKFRPGDSEVDEDKCSLFFTDPFKFDGFPGGESTAQLCDRTQGFLKELLAKDDDRTYLITTHGAAMRAMLNFLYEDPSSFWQEHVPYNLAVSIIETTENGPRLIAKDRVYYSKDDIVDRYADCK